MHFLPLDYKFCPNAMSMMGNPVLVVVRPASEHPPCERQFVACAQSCGDLFSAGSQTISILKIEIDLVAQNW
jgi:hypothetical protein